MDLLTLSPKTASVNQLPTLSVWFINGLARVHALTPKTMLIQVGPRSSDMFASIVSKTLNITITIHRVNVSIRQKESARERALCQLTECF